MFLLSNMTSLKSGKRNRLLRMMMKKIQNLLGMSTIKFLQVLSCGLVGLSLITFWGMRGSNFKDFCPQRPKMKAIPEDLLPKYSEMPAKTQEHFTLMLNSFHRVDLMKASIAHYAKCPIIQEIRVIWCEDSTPPGPEVDPAHYSTSKTVHYDVMPDTSLNNRFNPIKGLRTEAVMSIDDDIIIPCTDLVDMFEAWRARKRQLVGPYIRAHEITKDCRYKYHLGTGTLMRGHYSIVLTKAALLHRDYLEMYTHHMPKAIREYVDVHHNCEDLAMQFLVANVTQEPPEFVNSFWTTDLGKGPSKVKGISSGNHHQESRSACMNDMGYFYGGVLPLESRQLSDHGSLLWYRTSPVFAGIFQPFRV